MMILMILETVIKAYPVFFPDTPSGLEQAKEYGREMAEEFIKKRFKNDLGELAIYRITGEEGDSNGDYKTLLEYEDYKASEENSGDEAE
jgi:hypothetical protein